MAVMGYHQQEPLLDPSATTKLSRGGSLLFLACERSPALRGAPATRNNDRRRS